MPAHAGVAWEPILAATDLLPAASLWARVDEISRSTAACEEDPARAIVARLFYHAVRRSVVDGDLAAATAGLERYPWRNESHALRAVSDALRFLIAEGRWNDLEILRGRILPLLQASPSAGRNPWRIDREKEDIFSLLALAARNQQQYLAAISNLDEIDILTPLMQTMSVADMQNLSANEALPPKLRAGLARTLVTRQFLLNGAVSLETESLLARTNPVIGRHWDRLRLHGPKRKDRRLLFNLLATPRMTMDVTLGYVNERGNRADSRSSEHEEAAADSLDIEFHSSNNWWCALNVDRVYRDVGDYLDWMLLSGEHNAIFRELGAKLDYDRILAGNVIFQRRDDEEIKRLADTKSAPRILAEAFIEWAEASTWYTRLLGWDDGLDFALHQAVVTTRYGCQRQGGHGAYSRRAFELLHRRFPESRWAAATPYWFDYQHFSWPYRSMIERARATGRSVKGAYGNP